MVTFGITTAITNLNETHASLGIVPSLEASFFREWQENLPVLTAAEQAKLDRLKQHYLNVLCPMHCLINS